MTYLEPTIHDALERLLSRSSESASGFIRKLIIRELRDRGVLTDEALANMAIG